MQATLNSYYDRITAAAAVTTASQVRTIQRMWSIGLIATEVREPTSQMHVGSWHACGQPLARVHITSDV